MLNTVVATRFVRPMGKGQTKPNLIACEDDDGNEVELVVKCSSGCVLLKEKSLAYESIAAMLAADLGLPIPEPFIVELTDSFCDTVEPGEAKNLLKSSCRYAFGSKLVPPGFAVWATGGKVPGALTEEAAEIFVFDAIVVNSDRRPINPNCLFNGTELAIFDHELVFGWDQILFFKDPWTDGGLDAYRSREFHIFAGPYFEKLPSGLDRFIETWKALPDSRFDEYKTTLPVEWIGDGVFVDKIVSYLKQIRANIDIIVANALKVLT